MADFLVTFLFHFYDITWLPVLQHVLQLTRARLTVHHPEKEAQPWARRQWVRPQQLEETSNEQPLVFKPWLTDTGGNSHPWYTVIYWLRINATVRCRWAVVSLTTVRIIHTHTHTRQCSLKKQWYSRGKWQKCCRL